MKLNLIDGYNFYEIESNQYLFLQLIKKAENQNDENLDS